ncbi:hypothetical protein CPC08DRAFT_727878 [Agrocybe pediades]|nr:hypothetical protein CPC08DRAFT_727878 [Agrocybe pediades]
MINTRYTIAWYGSKTSTSVQRNHLRDSHPEPWISACDKLEIVIKAQSALDVVRDYKRKHDQVSPKTSPSDLDSIRRQFTPEAFVDAIDSDIPHCTTIHTRIMEVWDEHLDYLQDIMTGISRVGLTRTGHGFWACLVRKTRGLMGKGHHLIAFHHVSGRHTGEQISDAFLHVLNRLRIAEKIGWVTLDNASGKTLWS